MVYCHFLKKCLLHMCFMENIASIMRSASLELTHLQTEAKWLESRGHIFYTLFSRSRIFVFFKKHYVRGLSGKQCLFNAVLSPLTVHPSGGCKLFSTKLPVSFALMALAWLSNNQSFQTVQWLCPDLRLFSCNSSRNQCDWVYWLDVMLLLLV